MDCRLRSLWCKPNFYFYNWSGWTLAWLTSDPPLCFIGFQVMERKLNGTVTLLIWRLMMVSNNIAVMGFLVMLCDCKGQWKLPNSISIFVGSANSSAPLTRVRGSQAPGFQKDSSADQGDSGFHWRSMVSQLRQIRATLKTAKSGMISSGADTACCKLQGRPWSGSPTHLLPDIRDSWGTWLGRPSPPLQVTHSLLWIKHRISNALQYISHSAVSNADKYWMQ